MKNWKIQEGLSGQRKQYLLPVPLISLFTNVISERTNNLSQLLKYWCTQDKWKWILQTPQSPKTYYIHVYILHQAILLMPDLFFSACVWLLANSSINLYKLNDFLPSALTTNVFQDDRLHSDKLLNGVYNKCIRSQWTEKVRENPFD